MAEEENENEQASVFLYKRPSERAPELLQALFSQDPRQFRLSMGENRMQEVMQMDRALSEHGRAELVTDSYRWGRGEGRGFGVGVWQRG